ncbi:RDD family protein [Alkalinema pantanalense CENA528]|uniref:RDD family protein n=1 Tax=Alkalinema pantanalense TaxID=1620705 RepID=UPI003D6E668D
MKYFNRITLYTPESVALEFTLAGIGSRAFALLVDYHILALVIVVFLLLWLALSFQLTEYLLQLNIDYSGLSNWLIAIPFLIVFVIFVGYFIFFETLWKGQTPGKKWAKIRVIQDNGQPVSLRQATLRALLRPIDDTLFLGFVFIVLGKQEKRIGDWAAGTVVVQEELPPVGSAAFPLSGQAQEVADRLLAVADLTQLLPDDFAIVREYLQRRNQLSADAKATTSLNLAKQVQKVLTLDKLPFDMTPDLFLEGVYLAYQQQFGDRWLA